MVNDIAVQEFVNAIKEEPRDTNTTYNATVSRVDKEGIVWVNIHGSDKETPTASTSTEVKRGDSVVVNWRNNKLYIGGNYSNPSAGIGTVQPSIDFVSELYNKDITVNSINAATGYIEDLTSKNIKAEDISADHAMIRELDVESMAAAVAYIGDLTAENIEAEDIIADHATIDDLDVNYAQINAANVTDLSAQNAWVNKIMVQTGLIAHESNIFTLDAIQVNAANITAGTLDVNRLIVTVDGEKYLVEIDPTTHQPSYEKLDGGIVEPRTITADKIVAHDITVQEITTENLVGTNGWINLNQGKFFYTTNGSTWANTTNGIMWDGTSLKIKGDVNITSGNVYTKTQVDDALADKADSSDVYTKSDFSITPSQIVSKVTATETKLAGQYATSSTVAGTAAKVATITPAVTGWTLYTGATITVKFTNANTATAPTLNVNGTGAKGIRTFEGGTLAEKDYEWSAGDTFTFVYNGTYWLMQEATTRLKTAEASITTNAGNIALKANVTDVYSKTDANALLEVKANKDTLTSEINASADTVQINANRVNIAGVITAINDNTTTTINGNKITTGTLQASDIYIGADVLTNVLNNMTDELGNIYQLNILTSYTSTGVVHTAQLLQNGVDISAQTPNDFEWNAKLTTGYQFIGNGRSITIAQSSLHYAHAVTVSWTRRQLAYLLNNSGNNLVTSTGAKLMGRTEY